MSPAIRLEHVSFGYTSLSNALYDVTFQIDQGELTAIIGNNGSGKSTLMKLVVGLLRPTSGSVNVDGQDIRDVRVSTLARHVGFIFQNPNDQLFAQTVEDEIRFGLKNLRLPDEECHERTEEVLERFELRAVRSMFPRFLSRGDRQKVCIASVVAMRPRILLLDEPTTGQDHRDARSILDLAARLNDEGMTVVLVTHDLINVAAYARRILVLRDGRVVRDGATGDVLADLPLLDSCSLVTPQVVQLSLALGDIGMPLALRTVDFVDSFRQLLSNAPRDQ